MRHEFEPANKELAKRLQEVLDSKEKNCLVGIFLPLNKERKKFISHEAVYWTYIINDMKWRLFKTIKQDKQYYSAIISKFYLAYRNRSSAPKYVEKLKQVVIKSFFNNIVGNVTECICLCNRQVCNNR